MGEGRVAGILEKICEWKGVQVLSWYVMKQENLRRSGRISVLRITRNCDQVL